MFKSVLAHILASGALMAGLAGCATAPEPVVNPAASSSSSTASDTASASDAGLFIIGDTGVIGSEGSLATTSSMVRELCHDRLVCDFGMLSGDNIYPSGATGDPAQDAPVFAALFTEPFGTIWDGKPGSEERIFVALGNHDWYNGRAGAQAQVTFHEATRPFYMDGFFYSRRFTVRGKTVEIFVIDTEMLLASETLPRYKKGADGEMVASGKFEKGGTPNALPVTEQEQQQATWFAQALAASTADWKFVLGHHPIWQSRGDSKFAQSMKLRELILPALCQNADAYFAGHQHTIEVYSDSCEAVAGVKNAPLPLPQIVSGAGSKARSTDPDFMAWQAKTYPRIRSFFALGDTAGFVHIGLSGDTMTVTPITAGSDQSSRLHDPVIFTRRTGRSSGQ
ncbi:MAG: metallophosphoesterase [Sphingomonadaceae bacterium]